MFGFDDAIAVGLKVLDKFIPDPEAKAKAEKELREGLLAADVAQMGVNKVEAAHRSIFVAGWRPFIGWTSGSAFFLHFIAFPIAYTIEPTLPKVEFDMQSLMTVMLGMLGLGGMRTYEKMKGVSK